MKNPNWIEWAMSDSEKTNYVWSKGDWFDCINPDKTRELIKVLNPEGKKYMVFDIESVFNNLLRYEDGRLAKDDVSVRFKNIKSCSFFKCVDKLDNKFNVATVVGFADDGSQMLYARDNMWQHFTSKILTFNHVNND